MPISSQIQSLVERLQQNLNLIEQEMNEKQIAELEEMLEMVKMTEQKARQMCELSTAIAWKYQKRVQEIKKAREQFSEQKII